VADRGARLELRGDPFQDRDPSPFGPAVATKPGFNGVRADDRHAPQRLRQRQGPVLVAEQHDRFSRGDPGTLEVAGVAVHVDRLVDVDEGLLEQAQLELHAEHTGHRGIDRSAVDLPAGERGQIRAMLRPGGLEDDVQPGLDRMFRRRAGVLLRHVQDRRSAGGRGI
jgi:hypothetical protein